MPKTIGQLTARTLPKKAMEMKAFLDSIPRKEKSPYYTTEEVMDEISCTNIRIYVNEPILKGYSCLIKGRRYFSSPHHIKKL